MPLPERELIARIRKMGGKKSLIGDDCAVLGSARGHELLVTTDLCLEGVHFRRDWHPADSVGHRCLARGLSDIAAMAGEPLACFLSLGLPKEIPQKWVDGFLSGFLGLARRFGVPLAGGDTGESKSSIVADVMVVGSAPRGKALRRSGAKPRDLIYVTGSLGGSAAKLKCSGRIQKLLTAENAEEPKSAPRRLTAIVTFIPSRGLLSRGNCEARQQHDRFE